MQKSSTANASEQLSLTAQRADGWWSTSRPATDATVRLTLNDVRASIAPRSLSRFPTDYEVPTSTSGRRRLPT